MSSEQTTDTRSGYAQAVQQFPWPIYIGLCFIGTLLLSLLPQMLSCTGVAVIAYGTAVLVCRSKTLYAVLAVIVGCIPGLLWAGSLTLAVTDTVPTLVLGLLAVFVSVRASKPFGQARFFAGLAAFFAVSVGSAVFSALVVGTTVRGQIQTVVSTFLRVLTVGGTLPAEVVTVIKSLVITVASLWPAVYFVFGLLCMATLMIAARFAYHLHDNGYEVRPFTGFDLSVHLLWPFIIGLLCIAASYLPQLSAAASSAVEVIGYDLLICSLAVYAIQGFSLIVYWMRKAHLNVVVQVILVLIALQLEMMFLLPSVIGLLDMWLNFRKLPRDGSGKNDRDTVEEGS